MERVNGYCLLYDGNGEPQRVPCFVYKSKAAGTYIMPIPFHEPVLLVAGITFFVHAEEALKKLQELQLFERGF